VVLASAVVATPAAAPAGAPGRSEAVAAPGGCVDPCLFVGIVRVGTGRVVSDPPGLDCGSDCWFDYFQIYPDTVRFTPVEGTLQAWEGCPEQVGAACVIPVDNGTYCLRAIFAGTGQTPVPEGCRVLGWMPPPFPPPPPPALPPPPPAWDARCTIPGSPVRDVMRGTPRRDVICGRGGNDVIYGLRGADLLRGGPGNDTLYGGAGADRLDGGTGRDRARRDPRDRARSVERRF
jgi:hypothetical protein